MHKDIALALKRAKTLLHVEKELIKLFKITKNISNIARIGYVAGIINSDGPEYVKVNRKKLADHAEKLRKVNKFPTFSAVDVFSEDIYARLEEMKLSLDKREAKMRSFWRQILISGHVTDIFMTPRWKKSKGATDEHKIAKRIGLTIHYVEDAH